jgi:bifunctional non-homologous end joining protein LigD
MTWSGRYPWIVEAACKIRKTRFVFDGEAVILGVDGVSDFNALHSRKHDDEVQFCAFDIMALDGQATLDHARPEGIFVNPFECGEIGLDLFRAAYRMG